MKIALILMPFHRRISPLAEIGLKIGILKYYGYKVIPYDINNEIFSTNFKARKYWEDFHSSPKSLSQKFKNEMYYLANKIISESPDVIIFEAVGNTEINCREMAFLLKERNNNIPIIFTGLLHRNDKEIEEYLRIVQDAPIDFFIIGDDEFALPRLIQVIEKNEDISTFDEILKYKINGKIIDCRNNCILENMDKLPFFDFTDFDLNKYQINTRIEIFTSRGCIWRCKFCNDWQIQGKYRSMSGERIFEEFYYQITTHKNIQDIRLTDLVINGNIGAISKFCDLIIKAREKGLRKVYWHGDAIILPDMTKELLEKMNRAGCGALGYGLESGSEKVIRDMGKNFSIYTAEEVIRNTHEANMKTTVNIICGFPTETEEDFKQTIKFIERNSKYIDEVRLTFPSFRIGTGTALQENFDKYNLKDDNDLDYWQTKDGMNTYKERYRRFNTLAKVVLSNKIEFRLGGRVVRKIL